MLRILFYLAVIIPIPKKIWIIIMLIILLHLPVISIPKIWNYYYFENSIFLGCYYFYSVKKNILLLLWEFYFIWL